MVTFRTHYQNLKVAEDAPDAVIRAAYRSLAQQFHPDRNSGNAEAARIMAIINASWDVLSDPGRRRQHDAWIARMRADGATRNPVDPAAPAAASPPPVGAPATGPGRAVGSAAVTAVGFVWATVRYLGFFRTFGAIVLVWLFVAVPRGTPATPRSAGPYSRLGPTPEASAGPSTASAEPDPFANLSLSSPTSPAASAAYSRPLTAPNGEPWPTTAGYVRGYPMRARGGLSYVTVDNSGNGADVYVKLVDVTGGTAYPVRQVFIPAYGSITLRSIRAGRYDIRYRDLDSGALSRSEPFTLQEVPTDDGIRYSALRMTLYTVSHGNMQTYALSESEF